jgi:DNA-binding NarL/FixJ family response regulator
MLKIAIVDDHTLFRKGLKMLLENFDNISEINEAADGKEFLQMLETQNIDVVFMDIEMPEMNGIETTRKALLRCPNLKIIALSMYCEEEYFDRMCEAGASGYILKDSTLDILKNAIDSVVSGNKYYSQDILLNIVEKAKTKSEKQSIDLTNRELEILQLICKGLSNPEIARKLFLSKRTVDKHRENILAKTISKNTAELVIYAVKNKLTDS